MGELIGYARCSTVLRDLTAPRQALEVLGVLAERIYLDKGLTGTSRARPGLDQALAAVRGGDTLVVPKLDRLARSVSDAHQIDSLVDRGVKLSLGGTLPTRSARRPPCVTATWWLYDSNHCRVPALNYAYL